MSVRYQPVQWTRSKIFYDLVLFALVVAYILIYLRVAPAFLDHSAPVDGAIVQARAFGTCAFVMLTALLCIGPLARIDRRFLPLLYNRRHFGVLTFLVALTHAYAVLNWYFSFSPTPRLTALLGSNMSYGQVLGFPFETLGVLALLILAVLAATSHDFWLNFLAPRLWKNLHLLIYPAYALIVGHVALGALQSQANPAGAIVVGGSVLLVCGLHGFVAVREWGRDRAAEPDGGWHVVGDIGDFTEGRALIANLSGDRRVAVFLNDGKLSAISNACAHQNGPLGEGRVIDGCVTCPWHGFQYRLEDGCAPEPYVERIPTYALKIEGTRVLVSGAANPPGTYVAPLALPESTR